jgi:hypothetical protein
MFAVSMMMNFLAFRLSIAGALLLFLAMLHFLFGREDKAEVEVKPLYKNDEASPAFS